MVEIWREGKSFAAPCTQVPLRMPRLAFLMCSVAEMHDSEGDEGCSVGSRSCTIGHNRSHPFCEIVDC